MSAFFLPTNPYLSSFDFRLRFDLTDGNLKLDLSPSVIMDASGITGVKAQITRPDRNVVTPAGYIFTAGNINSVYNWALPKIQGIYFWGMYSVVLTLVFEAKEYPVSKTFNLCAPGDDPFSNAKQGTLELTLDCFTGKIKGRNFTGYPYRNQVPVSEVYNITRFYPPEAELSPQKSISVVPFSLDAYVGLNIFRGLNTSTYDFGDNIFAIIPIIAQNQKNVRCGVDLDSIYCGMESLMKQMNACNATPQEMNMTFGEINALLWLVTVGTEQNKDVEDSIIRLEKLLGVECRCQACAGSKVGPSCISSCWQVAEAQVIVSDENLVLSFDSTGFPDASTMQIAYRPFCDPTINTPFTIASPDVNLNGGHQTTNVPLTDSATYQVMLTTIMADGTRCDPQYLTAQGECPEILDINDVGVTPGVPSTTFVVDYGWSLSPFTEDMVRDFAYQRQATFRHGQNIRIDVTDAPKKSYIIVRYPKSELIKVRWYNDQNNMGLLPDQVWEETFTDSDFAYGWTRVYPAFNLKQLVFY